MAAQHKVGHRWAGRRPTSALDTGDEILHGHCGGGYAPEKRLSALRRPRDKKHCGAKIKNCSSFCRNIFSSMLRSPAYGLIRLILRGQFTQMAICHRSLIHLWWYLDMQKVLF